MEETGITLDAASARSQQMDAHRSKQRKQNDLAEFTALKHSMDGARAMDAFEDYSEQQLLKKTRVSKCKLPSFVKVRSESGATQQDAAPSDRGSLPADAESDGKRHGLHTEGNAPPLGMGLSGYESE